jgi:holin-like protein
MGQYSPAQWWRVLPLIWLKNNMLYGLIVFLLYLLMGEFIAHLLSWPVPGSVLGMLLLFITLVFRGGISTQLKSSSNGLLPYLPLFIVPASVGIVNFMGLIEQEGVALITAIVVSLLVGIPVCGLLAQGLIKRQANRGRKS